MNNRLITHLRHVDLAVPDFRKQLDFYQNIWGLELVASDTGVAFLAAVGSPEQYVVRLREAEAKRIDLLAFGAADAADVDAVAAKLELGDVKLISEPGRIDTPGGGYGFRFFDVDGRVVEISSDVAPRKHRKVQPKESVPVRLSHAVVNSADPERTVAFYERFLDFALSDTLSHPQFGGAMYFMRCNPQHHSLAIGRGHHASLHHVSFEMRGIDEYLRGTGRLLRAGTELLWGPGRHMAGDNTFSYFLDPSANVMEYTTAMEVLDEDTWHPHTFDFTELEVQDQWGTANSVEDMLARSPLDTPDPVFVAPPV
ncbi:VOC family protein [Streptomyces mangrovisoli]|uniref:Oxidoreductase n=1 Tax=Streptomyces mangrovisoli TaxID=1428628 RepID=A0A1J4NWE9_9ACTN|nr:VOC family protein [Streptomyces mangrovisoli]OIJ65486.1 oxidoreductase [Streptomyces mangrovisoli]